MTPWEWLVLPDVRIRTLGADPALRRHHVGTTRALPQNWARTLGMWRVAAVEDIEDVAEVSHRGLRMYAARHGLLWGPEHRGPACDLAIEAWRLSLPPGPLGEHRFDYAARRLGIHAAEAKLYADQAAVMLDALGAETYRDYLAVSPQDPGARARMWTAAPVLLEIPDEACAPS
jgi:hypothetical protein